MLHHHVPQPHVLHPHALLTCSHGCRLRVSPSMLCSLQDTLQTTSLAALVRPTMASNVNKDHLGFINHRHMQNERKERRAYENGGRGGNEKRTKDFACFQANLPTRLSDRISVKSLHILFYGAQTGTRTLAVLQACSCRMREMWWSPFPYTTGARHGWV